jgi:hypothetical protein
MIDLSAQPTDVGCTLNFCHKNGVLRARSARA